MTSEPAIPPDRTNGSLNPRPLRAVTLARLQESDTLTGVVWRYIRDHPGLSATQLQEAITYRMGQQGVQASTLRLYRLGWLKREGKGTRWKEWKYTVVLDNKTRPTQTVRLRHARDMATRLSTVAATARKTALTYQMSAALAEIEHQLELLKKYLRT